MEDVVFTLNNILDDITRMYADSTDSNHAHSVNSPRVTMCDPRVGSNGDRFDEKMNSLTPPDSSRPPLSIRSGGGSDSEDNLSLCSDSLESSPTSSGFTTPSLSPSSLTFVTDKDTVHLDQAPSFPLAEANKGLPLVTPGNILSRPTTQEHSSQADSELEVLETDPSEVAPILALEVSNIGLEFNYNKKSCLWTPCVSDGSPSPSLSFSQSSRQHDAGIIYQTCTRPMTPVTTPRDHMPGVSPPHLAKAPRLPPRSLHPREPPPHLPALRSHTLQSAPKLHQNEDWNTDSRTGRVELGGADHLMRQREWARLTITHASSLAEPKDLPPYRPVDKYLAWGSYSSCSVSPPRKRILGAMGRRVHIGPRMLPRGDWDPERRGGAIDRWNNREIMRRERMRTYEAEQEPKRDTGCQPEQGVEREGNAPAHLLSQSRFVERENEGEKGNEGKAMEHDEMRLCVKNGKRVASGSLDEALASGSRSLSEGSTSTVSLPVSDSLVDADSDTMRCGPDIDAANPLTEGVPAAPVHLDTELPYIPKKKSPLRKFLLPTSPTTAKFQLWTPGDSLNVGRARRKFASMMF
ncbi:hypothetical protein RhiXN_04082 [Rhizoctonia solani]|uniref:Uncharacterized protein n=1 Tax=Rhizoctonia solani TaxID=456999 RepID=A0A8H8NLP5_9AGAM|nr:uncharacterized protein RhiXN_04082 [Rhizoctonia solani]QRW16081.1 hypothetical protein RhiXN_04082 [Rhizoctonia solani]